MVYEGRVRGLSADRLIDVVRELDLTSTADGAADPGVVSRWGLVPLSEPSSHLVYEALVDGERCCLKIYRSWARNEPAREWLLLNALDGSGVAPRAVWHSPEGMRPALLTSWVEGGVLAGRSTLSREDARGIAHAHRVVHETVLPPSAEVAISAGAVVVARVLEWWPELGAMAADVAPTDAVQRYVADAPFTASTAAVELLSIEQPCLVRGDTNLANYVRGDDGIRMVDFEDSGIGSRAFEVADMVEHFANRTVSEDSWQELAMPVAPDDLRAARVIMAEFWFALTIRRNHRGLAMRPPITPAQQLDRVLALRG